MKKILKKIALVILPIALGVFLIWWSLSRLTISDKEEIVNAFKNANYFWIFISLFLGFLSHLSRAQRWQYLLAPLGYKPKFLNSVFTIFIAYMVNLAIPRAGEIARATGISKYEAIPFEKAFGTIVVERIVDVIMLLLVIVFAFLYQFDLLMELTVDRLPKDPIYSITLSVSILIVLVLGFILIRKSKNTFIKKIRQFILGLIDGVKSIYTMKKKGLFIAHTLFIWAMYLLMFYTFSLALPDE